jgi:hypothetical protein
VQLRLLPITHTPAPLQVLPAVSVDPVQVWAPQVVPLACSRQPPLPLQPPARPQLVAASAGHSFWGSWPDGMGVQVPIAVATLQAWQAWLQGPLQQTPSVHRPLAHWNAMVQATPGVRFSVQRVPSQKNPVWHSIWLAQVEAQLPPAHVGRTAARGAGPAGAVAVAGAGRRLGAVAATAGRALGVGGVAAAGAVAVAGAVPPAAGNRLLVADVTRVLAGGHGRAGALAARQVTGPAGAAAGVVAAVAVHTQARGTLVGGRAAFAEPQQRGVGRQLEVRRIGVGGLAGVGVGIGGGRVVGGVQLGGVRGVAGRLHLGAVAAGGVRRARVLQQHLRPRQVHAPGQSHGRQK